ncbi:MAG: hypothetical protein PUB63_02215 [Clostridia bacterium]|nr:hypothetical protein [Clostridia bacterium]
MIFGSVMRRLDVSDVAGSLRVMENHIRSLQEQLEYTLYNLDSTNVTELDTNITDIVSSDGGIHISGEGLSLYGRQGEKIVMGGRDGVFQLQIAGRGGQPAIYLDSGGTVVVGSQARIQLDCGTWD